MKKERVYLDYAAATPLESEVAKAMQEAEGLFANPSAQYASARESSASLAQARKGIALFLAANSDEVLFTSGATEANNLAILGSARAAGKGHIISVQTEHASVREPLIQLEKEGFSLSWCPVDRYGVVDLTAFAQLLRPDTILVSLSYASSEIGTIQPLAKVSRLIKDYQKQYKTEIVFHTDASAAAGLLNCEVARLGVDLLTLSAAKLYGPKGVGCLYRRRGTLLKPILFGGSQEAGMRAGSEGLSLAIGLVTALHLARSRRAADAKHFIALYEALNTSLPSEALENGHPKQRLYSVANYSFVGVSGEDLAAYLDAAGFEVATGAACEASNDEPSLALRAIGRTKAEAQGSLRVSFGRPTKQPEVIAFATVLAKSLKTLQSRV